MPSSRIRDLALRCIETQSVTDQLVGALARALEEGGFVSRAEAEDLLRIERDVAEPCAAWRNFFVATLVAHLVWEARPAGVVSREDIGWLSAQIRQPRPGAAACIGALLLALVREADGSDPSLVRLTLAENRGDELDAGLAGYWRPAA